MDKAVFTLEYNKIIQQLIPFCISEAGRKHVLELTPFYTFELISKAQKETTEAIFCYTFNNGDPFKKLDHIDHIIKKMTLNGVLTIKDLLAIYTVIEATVNTKNYMQSSKLRNKCPILIESSDRLINLVDIKDLIAGKIDEYGEIKDNASIELKNIRQEYSKKSITIRNQANTLLTTFKNYLQEPILTQRNGHYVFPIKASYRSKISGIVHDQSASGATLYIEPFVLADLYNQLRQLERAEALEIEKILKNLSEALYPYTEAISSNHKILTYFDLVFAKAKFSLDKNYKKIRLENNQNIELYNAKHPLLDDNIAIGNDIIINDTSQSLIITGPNTGGKTVCLKALGLLILMNQTGLYIPADENSCIGFFTNIFADIGDEQSIEQSLSTFSSHISNIKIILDKVNDKSLVLLDELGSGTDPTEGSSLAIAILNYLLAKNAKIMATTHYKELKIYAYETPFVENASVEFNVDTLMPTYRLIYGLSGKSNAFAIAQKIGIPVDIIEEAKEKTQSIETDTDLLIKSLEIEKNALLYEKQLYQNKLKKYHELENELNKEKQTIEQSKDKILLAAQKEADKIIKNAKIDIDNAISEIKNLQKEVNFHSIVKAQTIKNNLDKKTGTTVFSEPLKNEDAHLEANSVSVGLEVYIPTLNDFGIITEYQKGAKEAFVEVGNMKIKFKLSDLSLQKKQKKEIKHIAKEKKSVKSLKTTHISTTLDLRGELVDDALIKLDKYLDDAYLSSLSIVTIIHGKGTGALKKAVNDFLKRNSRVADFRLGNFNEGGHGVTIVTLK